MNDSYSNPFSGVNAAQLDEGKILEYWCNPFKYDLFSGIREDDIYEDPMNIVFMGGRSTGKSMFLRYLSYPLQILMAKKERVSFGEVIRRNKGIGFYFRIDGPTLKSFQGHGLNDEHWSSVFTHYFELVVGRQYIEALRLLQEDRSIHKEIDSRFLPKLCDHLGFARKNSLDELIEELDEEITYIDIFRGNVAFSKKAFEPRTRGFPSQSISFRVAELIRRYVPSFAALNMLILLDEYENFLEYQQTVINALLKFSKSEIIKFRIGMRLEGFRTYRMIGEEDFIKEGREYRKVVFEEVLNKDKGFHKFLAEIAKKRLESIGAMNAKGFTDIRSILLREENLESEAIELAKNKPDRTYRLYAKKLPARDLEKVRYRENPLMELLNFIWLARGESPEKTATAMRDYLDNNKTEDGEKYRRDYIDKYKLSLMFLLCSIYKHHKLYYSFNTFAFLSSGIIGNFIELCRRSFAISEWNDKDRLLLEGKISPECQARAALEFSRDERQQISRIEIYGGRLSRLVNNLGNVFRDYHLDFSLRYPETNQFAINLEAIQDPEVLMAMRSAIKWSVVQKKPALQRTGPSEHLHDTYTINRIFAPIFQISYRTRGGKSVVLNEEKLRILMSQDDIDMSGYLPKRRAPGEGADEKTNFSLFPE